MGEQVYLDINLQDKNIKSSNSEKARLGNCFEAYFGKIQQGLNMIEKMNVSNPEYWIEQWNNLNAANTVISGYSTQATWNAMAANYCKHNDKNDNDKRIKEVISKLENAGFCFKNSRILDAGCGPGYYAKAFAERGANVVCIDISEKMIQRLKDELPESIQERVTAFAADWRSLNLVEKRFISAFDLVFANMTPAVTTHETLFKLIKASRKLCWFSGWVGPRKNSLHEQIVQTVKPERPYTFVGNFMVALNLLVTSGFYPDCSFTPVQWTQNKTVEELLDFYSVFLSENSRPVPDKIRNIIEECLRQHARNGVVQNSVKGCTGRMLWSVQQ